MRSISPQEARDRSIRVPLRKRGNPSIWNPRLVILRSNTESFQLPDLIALSNELEEARPSTSDTTHDRTSGSHGWV
jgi:hypothetical protein